jgi:hypothetical protein
MQCLICAKNGVETQAVAVCLVCGMAMCQEHFVQDELPVEDVINMGFSRKTVTYPQKHPRYLCKPCHAAFVQREE